MERRTIRVIEPIAGVEWQKLQFGALGQVGRLVDNQPSRTDTCLDGHGTRVTLEEPPNKRLQPSALGAIVKRRG